MLASKVGALTVKDWDFEVSELGNWVLETLELKNRDWIFGKIGFKELGFLEILELED